jgi:hypothetical protein
LYFFAGLAEKFMFFRNLYEKKSNLKKKDSKWIKKQFLTENRSYPQGGWV